jgi:hypothetical protein
MLFLHHKQGGARVLADDENVFVPPLLLTIARMNAPKACRDRWRPRKRLAQWAYQTRKDEATSHTPSALEEIKAKVRYFGSMRGRTFSWVREWKLSEVLRRGHDR